MSEPDSIDRRAADAEDCHDNFAERGRRLANLHKLRDAGVDPYPHLADTMFGKERWQDEE